MWPAPTQEDDAWFIVGGTATDGLPLAIGEWYAPSTGPAADASVAGNASVQLDGGAVLVGFSEATGGAQAQVSVASWARRASTGLPLADLARRDPRMVLLESGHVWALAGDSATISEFDPL